MVLVCVCVQVWEEVEQNELDAQVRERYELWRGVYDPVDGGRYGMLESALQLLCKLYLSSLTTPQCNARNAPNTAFRKLSALALTRHIEAPHSHVCHRNVSRRLLLLLVHDSHGDATLVVFVVIGQMARSSSSPSWMSFAASLHNLVRGSAGRGQ